MVNVTDPFARFEQDFNEKIAGTAGPDLTPKPAKTNDAEPIRVWTDHQGQDL
jgi:hypothetical protein